MNKEKILRKVQKVIKGLDQTKDDLIEVSYLLDDMLVACVELEDMLEEEDMLEDSTIQDKRWWARKEDKGRLEK